MVRMRSPRPEPIAVRSNPACNHSLIYLHRNPNPSVKITRRSNLFLQRKVNPNVNLIAPANGLADFLPSSLDVDFQDVFVAFADGDGARWDDSPGNGGDEVVVDG